MADTTFLQADLRERQNTDVRISFWLTVLLSIVTLGIYSYYVIWQLVSRRDRHFQRVARLAEDATVYLRARAQETGADLSGSLARLEAVQLSLRKAAPERGALIWVLLCFFTSGIANYILWYVLMSDFRRHEDNEAALIAAVKAGLGDLGPRPDLPFRPEIVDRSFWLYFCLTFITLGIFWIYWWYCLINDPNRHFDAHVAWETELEQLAAAPAQQPPPAPPTPEVL